MTSIWRKMPFTLWDFTTLQLWHAENIFNWQQNLNALLWSHKILYKLEENTRIKILKAILSIRGLTYTSIYEIELQTNITTVNEAVLTSSTTSIRKRERERERERERNICMESVFFLCLQFWSRKVICNH